MVLRDKFMSNAFAVPISFSFMFVGTFPFIKTSHSFPQNNSARYESISMQQQSPLELFCEHQTRNGVEYSFVLPFNTMVEVSYVIS